MRLSLDGCKCVNGIMNAPRRPLSSSRAGENRNGPGVEWVRQDSVQPRRQEGIEGKGGMSLVMLDFLDTKF